MHFRVLILMVCVCGRAGVLHADRPQAGHPPPGSNAQRDRADRHMPPRGAHGSGPAARHREHPFSPYAGPYPFGHEAEPYPFSYNRGVYPFGAYRGRYPLGYYLGGYRYPFGYPYYSDGDPDFLDSTWAITPFYGAPPGTIDPFFDDGLRDRPGPGPGFPPEPGPGPPNGGPPFGLVPGVPPPDAPDFEEPPEPGTAAPPGAAVPRVPPVSPGGRIYGGR